MVAWIGFLRWLLIFGVKNIFKSKESLSYIATVENDFPIILFQSLFLAFITSFFLPFFFKLYGAVTFGSFGMILNKGFDQALDKKTEGRLLQTNNTNSRAFYDLYS